MEIAVAVAIAVVVLVLLAVLFQRKRRSGGVIAADTRSTGRLRGSSRRRR